MAGGAHAVVHTAMDDADQTQVPDSFVAIYMQPGRLKPTASRAAITARYEWCEDLANHLFEYTRAQHFDLGIAESDVLNRVHQGLLGDASGVNSAEATWVVYRLAELQGWPCPAPSGVPPER